MLLGLQQQVLLNYINVAFATVRAVGAICLLRWIGPTVEMFFIWQLIVSLIGVIVFIPLSYNLLPKTSISSRFSIDDLVQTSGFAGNVMLINLTQILFHLQLQA